MLEALQTILKGKLGLEILAGIVDPLGGQRFKFGPREDCPMRFPILVKHRTFPDAAAAGAEVVAVIHVGVGALKEANHFRTARLMELIRWPFDAVFGLSGQRTVSYGHGGNSRIDHP